jgi:DNA-binding NtrC family response regulator
MSNGQIPPRKRPADLYVHCVVLSSLRSEFTFLKNVFRLTGLRMHYAETLEEADFLLTVTDSTVLLSDVLFEGGCWQAALQMLHERHQLVPMLVIADPADRPFLKDLFERGACGVVWKPVDFDAARKLIRTLHEASKERRLWLEETAQQHTPAQC